jgi:hypothetical protein
VPGLSARIVCDAESGCIKPLDHPPESVAPVCFKALAVSGDAAGNLLKFPSELDVCENESVFVNTIVSPTLTVNTGGFIPPLSPKGVETSGFCVKFTSTTSRVPPAAPDEVELPDEHAAARQASAKSATGMSFLTI